MKVAPGGTEDIDSTVYEGVVLTALPFVSKHLRSHLTTFYQEMKVVYPLYLRVTIHFHFMVKI